LSVAKSDQVGFIAGGASAFYSLRNIRKEQQRKKTSAITALVKAKPYYCPAPTGGRARPIAGQLADPGVCIRTFKRRFAGSSASLSRRPVPVASRQCGAAVRFRVGDLNCDGIVYANRERAGKSEKFRLIRAVNRPGLIRAGELFVLVSARAFSSSPI
jgi:hypothetical protein